MYRRSLTGAAADLNVPRPVRRSIRLRLVLSSLSALVTAAALASPALAQERPFESRFSTNDTGDIAVIGNTLMTCQASAPLCSTVQAGGGTGAQTSNNAYDMDFVDVDGDPTTANSSTALLDLPPGATVLFAGLYYGGRTTAGASGAPAPAPGDNDLVLFAAPGGAYTTLTADQLDPSTVIAGAYGAFVDVTDEVAAAGPGVYQVADVQAGTGIDRYAGWSLVVAYRDPTEPPRNLSVFDGLQAISQGDPPVSIPLSGFQTPATGPVLTTAGFVSYEGDRSAPGDRVSLNDIDLADPANPATNFFNSTIGGPLGVPFTDKNPDYRNQLGFDADLVAANGILPNNATSAMIRLRTTGEQYIGQVATLATELYAPRLEATKEVTDVNGGEVRRGDTLSYTVTFTNTGQDTATQIVAADRIPAGTTYVPGSLAVDSPGQGEFEAANDRVVARLGAGAGPTVGGSLGPGASATFTFDVAVNADTPPGTEITNVATSDYFAATSGAVFQGQSPPATVTVQEPDLTLTKTHAGSPVGGTVGRFTISLSNEGGAASSGPVTVTDTFPGAFFGTPLVVFSAPGWDCSATTALTLSCTRSDAVPAGGSYPPIVVDAPLLPAATTFVNTATVAGGGDANPVNNSATDVGPVLQRADVQITKTASRQTVFAGERVEFTLTVRNAGPSTAADVTVDDPLPASFEDPAVTTTLGTCTPDVTCDLGDMAPGDEATITISAAPTALGPGTNTASAGSPTLDPTAPNNSADADFEVVASSDLSIVKAITDPPLGELPTAGGPLTYTLTVTNGGASDATGVTVIDPLPVGLTSPTIAAPGFTCNSPGAGETLTCTGGAIADGDSETIEVSGTLAPSTAGQVVDNAARVSGDQADPDPSDNSGSVSTTPIPRSDLDLTKTGPAAPVQQGDTATFTLRLTNLGPTDATGVTIDDALPAGLEFISATGSCSATGADVTCPVGALASGASTEVTITVRATQAGTLRNVATAEGNQPDPVGANNEGAAEVVVEPPPIGPPPTTPPAPPQPRFDADVAVTVTPPASPYTVGLPGTWRLRVVNNGPSAATNVQLEATRSGARAQTLGASIAQTGCRPGVSTECGLGNLAVGESRTVRLRLRPLEAGRLTVAARVDADEPDSVPPNDTDEASIRARRPDLVIDNGISGQRLEAGRPGQDGDQGRGTAAPGRRSTSGSA